MPNRITWLLFLAGIGLLLIVLSPTMSTNGTVSYPLLFGGLLIAAIGGINAWRVSRKAKRSK